MAQQTYYLDSTTGGQKLGYIIDGKTYEDEAGSKPIANGSLVTAGNGTVYQKTDNGGVPFVGTAAALGLPSNGNGSPYALGGSTPTNNNADISSMYDNYTKSKTDALTAAYNKSALAAQNAKDQIPLTYYDAKNSTASQNEVQRRNMNEYNAANGLNTGAGSQAQLAMSGALQSNLSALDKQQAKDLSAADLNLAQLKADYEGQIAAALAEGKFQAAQALYNKLQSDEAAARNQAQFDANYKLQQQQLDASNKGNSENSALKAAELSGIYDGMSAFGWTPQQIAGANAQWKLQNTPKTTYSSSGGGGGGGDITPYSSYEDGNIPTGNATTDQRSMIAGVAQDLKSQGMTNDQIMQHLTGYVRKGLISSSEALTLVNAL